MTGRAADFPIPDKPSAPFPLVTGYCNIVCGFGRGSAELGIPTANVPVQELSKTINGLQLGVYFGFAKIKAVDHEPETVSRNNGTKVKMNYGRFLSRENGDLDILPVVLSVGKNPFYDNDFKTAELYIVHEFDNDFYGAQVKFNILGYIRPELNYTTKEALIQDIKIDIKTALKVLNTENYKVFRSQLAD